MSKKSLFKEIEIKNPCSKSWDEMRGDDRVRFCEHCAFEVNNVSALTRKEALRLVRRSNGRICLRYERDPRDLTPVFAARLYRISRRAGLAAGVLGASLSLSTAVYAQEKSDSSAPDTEISQEVKVERKTASVSGIVSDSNGAAVSFALVTLFNERTGFYQSTNTTAEGFYEFKDVPDGVYKLRVDGSGFDPKEISALDLGGGGNVRQDAQLAVQKVQETVEVSQNPKIESESFGIMGDIAFVEPHNPLVQAVFKEDLEEVKVRVAMRARVNAKDNAYDGITALHAAVELGNVEIAEFLLTHGAKVNGRDNLKRTPLMMLDEDASPEMIRLLLRFGAKINLVDKEGNTALHHLAEFDQAEVLQIFVAGGANVNAVNKEGRTPLMNAAENNSLENVKTLLTAGADVNFRNKEGETALDLSKGEIREWLVSYGATAKIN